MDAIQIIVIYLTLFFFNLVVCFSIELLQLLAHSRKFNFLLLLQVVQEYERAVIFRLGRLRSGGARGPGIFFILPCIDTYCKVDLRTVSFDVPPQEVKCYNSFKKKNCVFSSLVGDFERKVEIKRSAHRYELSNMAVYAIQKDSGAKFNVT